MAKELIFDSERQARRSAKTRRLLPLLLALALLLILAVILLVIRAGQREVRIGGEDTPYPYSWQQRSDGSVRLEIGHADAPDYRWTLKDTGGFDALHVDREEKESGKKTVFLLRSDRAGRALFTLALEKEGEPTDRLYEITFQTETLDQGDRAPLSILGSVGNALQSSVSGGDSARNPYRIYSDENGELVVEISIAENDLDWQFQIPEGEDCVSFLGALNLDNRLLIYLGPGEQAGGFRLEITGESAAARISLQGLTEENGAFRITEHSAEYWEKPVAENETDTRTTEQLYEVTGE